MINDDKIEKKFRPLNDKVANIKLKFGLDVSNELIDRIEYTLKSFLTSLKISLPFHLIFIGKGRMSLRKIILMI